MQNGLIISNWHFRKRNKNNTKAMSGRAVVGRYIRYDFYYKTIITLQCNKQNNE